MGEIADVLLTSAMNDFALQNREFAHVLVSFLYGFVPVTVWLGHWLLYGRLWKEVRYKTQPHPVKDRKMTYWEKVRDESRMFAWHRVVLTPIMAGLFVEMSYLLIRLTVLLVM
jgi:hypothetical protein